MSPVYSDGTLRAEIAAILQAFSIDPNSPLTKLSETAMGRWVTKGSERWEEPSITLDDHALRILFWRCVGILPLYDEMRPICDEFDHILVLGGSMRPQDRKNALVARLWEHGVRYANIVHLGGDRKLNATTESWAALRTQSPGGLPVRNGLGGPTGKYETEADMMYHLWQRSDLPAGLPQTPTVIRASATTGHRANTMDTYRLWLRGNPTPGRVLIMSISPHAPFQYWDAVTALEPLGLHVHIAAPSASLGPQDPSYYLGGLARWLRSYCRAHEAGIV